MSTGMFYDGRLTCKSSNSMSSLCGGKSRAIAGCSRVRCSRSKSNRSCQICSRSLRWSRGSRSSLTGSNSGTSSISDSSSNRTVSN